MADGVSLQKLQVLLLMGVVAGLQVLGHSKTILVLLTSWAVFQEAMTQRKMMGMALAVVGMVMYGAVTHTASKPAVVKSKKSD
jgi:solute carrier family 35 protein E3